MFFFVNLANKHGEEILGLIIIVAVVCAFAILLGTEFIRFLLSDLYRSGAGGYQPGKIAAFCLHHRRVAIAVATVWVVCWGLISLYGLYEFIIHSDAYF